MFHDKTHFNSFTKCYLQVTEIQPTKASYFSARSTLNFHRYLQQTLRDCLTERRTRVRVISLSVLLIIQFVACALRSIAILKKNIIHRASNYDDGRNSYVWAYNWSGLKIWERELFNTDECEGRAATHTLFCSCHRKCSFYYTTNYTVSESFPPYSSTWWITSLNFKGPCFFVIDSQLLPAVTVIKKVKPVAFTSYWLLPTQVFNWE